MQGPVRIGVVWLAILLSARGAAPVAQTRDDRAVDVAGLDPALLFHQFVTRSDTPLERYHARRRMSARNPRFNKDAWLEVDTRLDPSAGFAYEVVASGGSPLVINRALLPALRGEADLWRTGAVARHGLTLENYDVVAPAAAPGDPQDVQQLRIIPRRRHVLLVDGALYLSRPDADLVRVEGRLSRNPSFWVSRVDVVRRYGRVADVRVPISIESIAHVRLAGPSEMRIDYFYDTINGQPVDEP